MKVSKLHIKDAPRCGDHFGPSHEYRSRKRLARAKSNDGQPYKTYELGRLPFKSGTCPFLYCPPSVRAIRGDLAGVGATAAPSICHAWVGTDVYAWTVHGTDGHLEPQLKESSSCDGVCCTLRTGAMNDVKTHGHLVPQLKESSSCEGVCCTLRTGAMNDVKTAHLYNWCTSSFTSLP